MGQNGINTVYSSFYSINRNAPFVSANSNLHGREIVQKNIPSVYLSDVLQEQLPKKKSHKKIWAITIGGLILSAWALTRTGNGKYIQKAQDMLKRVNNEIALGKNAKTFTDKTKYYMNVVWAKILHIGNCISNFTPIKDRIFDRIFRNKYARALKLDIIPNTFTKWSRAIAMRTNTKFAKNVISSADDLNAYLSKLALKDSNKRITIGSETKTVGEWIKKIQELAANTKSTTNDVFGRVARDSRFASVDNELVQMNLNSRLEEKLFGLNVKGQSGINLKGRIRNIWNSIKNGYQTQIITNDLRVAAENNLDDACKNAVENTNEIKKILEAIYGKNASVHLSEVNKYTKALQNASNFEKGLYLRLGELKAGAALTDMGFLTLSAGTGVYAIASQDSKEKTIAKSLTTGIPIIGGTGLCLLMTSLGLTGIAPLLIGFLGGKLISMCGAAVADKYLASANEKKRFMEELIALRAAQSKIDMENSANPIKS